MIKRGAQFLFFSGLGLSLALLVIVVFSPNRDAALTSQNPVRSSPAAMVGESESPERPIPRARLQPNSEVSGSDRFEPPRESVPGPPATLRKADTSAVDGAVDLNPDTSTVALNQEIKTDANEQSEDDEYPSNDVERPLGWCFFTTMSHDFISDSSTVWNGSRSVLMGKKRNSEIESHIESDVRVNALLWQGVDATAYRGSRIEISAHVQTPGGVVLALSTATGRELVPGNSLRRSLPSTHRFLRPLSATDWTMLSIVGDIPLDADVMYYAVSHFGDGSLWVDDVRVTEVGPESPVTEAPPVGIFNVVTVDPSSTLAAPTNLDFELTNRDLNNDATNIAENACDSVRLDL